MLYNSDLGDFSFTMNPILATIWQQFYISLPFYNQTAIIIEHTELGTKAARSQPCIIWICVAGSSYARHKAHITFATTLIIIGIIKLKNMDTNGYLLIHLSARNIKGFLIFFNSFSSCSIIPCCTCLFLNFTLHSSQIMGCSVL